MSRPLLALPLVLALGACEEPPPPEDPPVVVRSWLDGEVTAQGGTLVVQAQYDPEGELDLPQPEVEGLEFEAEQPILEVVGDHEVITQRFAFTGGKGAYEISALSATWHGPEGVTEHGLSSPVFVDLGVEPPREAEPADIAEPPKVWTIPWAILGGGALALALLGGGLAVAFGGRGERELPELPPEPPDVVALRAWEAVRRDPALDDEAKALHLSRIFRDYADAVLAFPAAAWTTTEILAHLRELAHLPEGNVPRAKRLLRATDRVKFAEHTPGVDFFEELDADLRAFVESTRPRAWDDGEGS